MLNELAKRWMRESGRFSKVVFHIGGTNRVVRLGDHKPSFSDPRLETLEISYIEPMETIRQKIEAFLSK